MATVQAQSRSKSPFGFPMPMPSFKRSEGSGAGSGKGSFTPQRAASPAPSSSSLRLGRDVTATAGTAAGSSSAAGGAAGAGGPTVGGSGVGAPAGKGRAQTARSTTAASSSSIKSSKSLTGSLLSVRSLGLGKIASRVGLGGGGRLALPGARARPAHPPPETFTLLKDLVLVDEPGEMDLGMDLRCGGEEMGGSDSGLVSRGANWGKGKMVSDDDGERQTQGQQHRAQNHPPASGPRPNTNTLPPKSSFPGQPPQYDSDHDHTHNHDHNSNPDGAHTKTSDSMPTQTHTHTLPPGAALPSRTESGNVNANVNANPALISSSSTADALASASASGPTASSSSNSNTNGNPGTSTTSTNPLTQPRSKSRTIIRMLTTKFSAPPSSSSSNPSHPSSSNHASASTSTSPPSHPTSNNTLHIKLPSKPKAPPKVAPTAFADPAARAAALRARGLLPPLPVLDLSEQERERDARLPVLESEPGAQERRRSMGMGIGAAGEGQEVEETAADRIKREWAAKHGIEIPKPQAQPVLSVSEPVEGEVVQELVVPVVPERPKDPQRDRMRAFKFGGGSTPTTPVVDVTPVETKEKGEAPVVEVRGEPPVTPVTPIGLDIDVSLIDFSAPEPAPQPTAAVSSTSLPTLPPTPAPTAPSEPTPSAPTAESTTETVNPAPPHSNSTENPPPPITVTAEETPLSLAPTSAAGDSDKAAGDKGAIVVEDAVVEDKDKAVVGGDDVVEEDAAEVKTKVRALPALPVVAAKEDVEAKEDVAEVAKVEEPAISEAPTLEIDTPTPAPEVKEEEETLLTFTPPTSTETPSRSGPTPPTSPSLRAAFHQTPPSSPPPVRTLPPIPSLPISSSSPAIETKTLRPPLLTPSFSSDTQASSESEDSVESSNSGSTTESAPVATPVTPAFASNNPFADASTPTRLAPGKLGALSVKTQGGAGAGTLPVLVHSPVSESMLGIPLEVVHEHEHEESGGGGGWLDSQATTPAAVPVDKNPADEMMESIGLGLDKGAFSRGLAEDNSLALGLGLDTTSPGTEQVVEVPAPPTSPQAVLPTPLSPNRVPAVTISTPAAGPGATKRRGMTDPGAPERRKSLFGGFRKGDGGAGEGAENGAPQRRVSVVASLGNLRRSVVGTISGAEKRDKKAASRSRSPRRFDASHLPPSPSPFAGFSSALNGGAAGAGASSMNPNDAYRNEGAMPSSPRTTSSHGSGSLLSQANSNTVLAPGSAPQLRRGVVVPGSPVQRRAAVEPTMYSRGSILLETAAIEDEETRRMTEMAFLG